MLLSLQEPTTNFSILTNKKEITSGIVIAPPLSTVPRTNIFRYAGTDLGHVCTDPIKPLRSYPNSLHTSPWPALGARCRRTAAWAAGQSFIMSPVELVKVRLQLAGSPSAAAAAAAALSPAAAAVGSGGVGTGGGLGAFALAAGVVRSVGVLGLLSRGLGATMGRDVLPHGVWFATYEWCKQEFSRREGVKATDNGALSVGAQLASGGVAATVAWLVGESNRRGPNHDLGECSGSEQGVLIYARTSLALRCGVLEHISRIL